MTETLFRIAFPSPLGTLAAASDGLAVLTLGFVDDAPLPASRSCALLDALREQLDAYFAGRRTTFDLPLAPSGTPFQRTVWDALREIPYGRTESYGALARRVGSPAAVRAVGAANGRNPIAIVIPCHRVIGGDGTLTGYAGGLARKRALLDLEASAGGPGVQRPLALAD